MKKVLTILMVVCFTSSVFSAETPVPADDQKILQAIGMTLARSLSIFNLTPTEYEQVLKGQNDALAGKKSEIDLSIYSGKIQEFAKERRKANAEKFAPMNIDFLNKSAKMPGAVKTDSGLVYIPVKDGSGAHPLLSDIVKVNYRGTLADGKEFDSSFKRGKPAELKLEAVIKCWTEGLQKMKVGGSAKLICPASLAYGDAGAGEQILPGAALAFEVDLLEIKK